jgi:hypothetical protein
MANLNTKTLFFLGVLGSAMSLSANIAARLIQRHLTAEQADRLANDSAAAITPRFSDPDPDKFGLTRAIFIGRHKISMMGGVVIRTSQAKEIFAPMSSAQRQMVATLKQGHQSVAFYTVGLGKAQRNRGPAYMTETSAEAPNLAQTESVFQSLRKNAVKVDRINVNHRWLMYARPIKATSEACVSCHNQQEGHQAYKLQSTMGMLVVAIKQSD